MERRTNTAGRPAIAGLAVLAAAVALAACGGSSGSATTSTSASAGASTAVTTPAPTATQTATTPSTQATAPAQPPATATQPAPKAKKAAPVSPALAANIAAARACLARQGLRFPNTPAAKNTPLFGSPPPGVAVSRYRAALSRCLGVGGLATKSLYSPQRIKAAVARFVACMRADGVKLPPGKAGGAIINLQGVDTRSPQYLAAVQHCRSTLRFSR